MSTPRNEHLGRPGWYMGVISGLLTSYSRYQAFICKLAPIGVLSRKLNTSQTENWILKQSLSSLSYTTYLMPGCRTCPTLHGLLLDTSVPSALHAHQKIGDDLSYENLVGSWNCRVKTIGLKCFKVKTTVWAIVETWKLTTFCLLE